MLLKDMLIKDNKKIKVYAFVGPSGTGKSYRAQMVASEKNINFIIDDGLLIKDNEVIAGESAKKAPTKIETVKHALFYKDEEKETFIKFLIKKHIFRLKQKYDKCHRHGHLPYPYLYYSCQRHCWCRQHHTWLHL